MHDALRAVLHSVLFQRCLGMLRPREATSGLFPSLAYASVDDPEVEAAVEARVRDVLAWAEANPGRSRLLLTLSFFERRERHGWLSTSEERMTWELWRLPLTLLRPDAGASGWGGGGFGSAASDERAARHAALEAALCGVVRSVVNTASGASDHLPPVASAGIVSYPFDIVLSHPDSADGAFGVSTLSRLVAGSPPTLL